MVHKRLRRIIQNRRQGLLSKGVCFLMPGRMLQQQYGKWLIVSDVRFFDHPRYSPKLSPSDYHIFPKLAEFLGGVFGRRLRGQWRRAHVNRFLTSIAANFYDKEIKRRVSQHDTCLNSYGSYVANKLYYFVKKNNSNRPIYFEVLV